MAKKKAPKAKEKKASGDKKKNSSKRYKLYESSGDKVTRKNKFCPKCGIGIFMAKHGNRSTCGKCGFTEFSK